MKRLLKVTVDIFVAVNDGEKLNLDQISCNLEHAIVTHPNNHSDTNYHSIGQIYDWITRKAEDITNEGKKT